MSDHKNEIKNEINILIAEASNIIIVEELNGKRVIKDVKDFEYQKWYTKSLYVIKQTIPERLTEFKELYRIKNRKNIISSNYTISDYFLDVTADSNGLEFFNPRGLFLNKFLLQIGILRSVENVLDSVLYDIKGILRADLFDGEIESSESLLKSKHYRAAGTLAGVVLESHLCEVCKHYGISFRKKNLSIADYNDALKDDGVLDLPKWRKIQALGDIRNLCSHKKERNPTPEEVQELIEGVKNIIKTIF